MVITGMEINVLGQLGPEMGPEVNFLGRTGVGLSRKTYLTPPPT